MFAATRGPRLNVMTMHHRIEYRLPTFRSVWRESFTYLNKLLSYDMV